MKRLHAAKVPPRDSEEYNHILKYMVRSLGVATNHSVQGGSESAQRNTTQQVWNVLQREFGFFNRLCVA